MSCLERFRWIKLPRLFVPDCNGILSYWAHLAARAAFRRGIASYCGHRNPVEPGTWAGGIVGLKSILGVKKREQALDILRQLSDLGYLSFELDTKTKLLTYRVTDYELDYCGAPCDSGAVYTTPGYGFLCSPVHYRKTCSSKLLTIRFSCSQTTETFSGRPTVSWTPSRPSTISLCRSSTLF